MVCRAWAVGALCIKGLELHSLARNLRKMHQDFGGV